MPTRLTSNERKTLLAIAKHPTLAHLLPSAAARSAVQRLTALQFIWSKSGVLHLTAQGEEAVAAVLSHSGEAAADMPNANLEQKER
jgi:hypothetical protein